MYSEVDEFLKKIEDEISTCYGEVDITLLNSLEHILFEAWQRGWDDGFSTREE